MTGYAKIAVLEYLYNYYIEHDGEQFWGEIEDLQKDLVGIKPQFIEDAAFALRWDGLIDGVCCDNTMTNIIITSNGVSYVEGIISAKNKLRYIDDISEDDKITLINTIPDIAVDSPDSA